MSKITITIEVDENVTNMPDDDISFILDKAYGCLPSDVSIEKVTVHIDDEEVGSIG